MRKLLITFHDQESLESFIKWFMGIDSDMFILSFMSQ